MAASLSRSFLSGTSLYSTIPNAVESPACISSRSRVVCRSGPSTTMRGSEGNVAKREREVSRFTDTGIEQQRELWWAPLFNVAADEQWSNLLTKESEKEETAEQRIAVAGSPGAAPPRTTTAAVALSDLINSSKSSESGRPILAKVAAFTPEKARALRKSMRASKTWHDGWYHSAIASRLAEPVD